MSPELQDLRDKTCLITGGSSGIGHAAALALARRGARVLIASRHPQRGREALDDLRRRSENPAISLHLADLSSQAGVRQLAAEVQAQTPRLDVLINVAGALFHRRTLSTDGIEMNLALNYLSYFLLTRLLLDRLVSSAPARIVNVTSVAHWWGRINFADLENRRAYNIFTAYGDAKLAIILFTRELARRLAGTGVSANCIHPGVVATHIVERVVAGPLARSFADFFFLSPSEGAEGVVFLAASPKAARWNGAYFAGARPGWSAPRSRNHLAAQRLWETSEQYTGLSPREVALQEGRQHVEG